MKCERYIQEEEADIVECSPRKKRSGGSKNKFSNSIFTFLSLKRWWVGGVDIKCFFFIIFFFTPLFSSSLLISGQGLLLSKKSTCREREERGNSSRRCRPILQRDALFFHKKMCLIENKTTNRSAMSTFTKIAMAPGAGK